MSTDRQKQLPFDGEREARRQERIEKLLGRLGQPEKLTTGAKMFDYTEATAIAKADSKRVARLASVASKRPEAEQSTK